MAYKKRRSAPRRSYGKKVRRSGSRKATAWKLVKGVAYAGAVAVPIYGEYTRWGGTPQQKATSVIKEAAFIDPETNQFSLDAGSKIWLPVAAIAVVDVVTTKLPVQRVIARGFRNLGF